MKFTEEQRQIIDFEGNLCVNAVAGSGKTTVLAEYAKTRPTKKFLYTCFNRSVKEEAQRKFPSNVKVVNMHSLAYKEMEVWNRELAKDFGTFDVVDLFSLGDKLPEAHALKVAFHIFRKFHFFTCSDLEKIDDFDYEEMAGDSDVALNHLDEIDKYSREIWGQMEDGKIPITHNFYLKQYQLSKPVLDYDYILSDENQDSSACISDVFIQQKAKKIATGDVSQAIYGWLSAINAIPKLIESGFATLDLTYSFRFRQDVAELANTVLSLKKKLAPRETSKKLIGCGDCKETKTRAIISRSNIGVFKSGIDVLAENPNTKLHFEGDINSYVFCNEGSIYDVLGLMTGRKPNPAYPNKLMERFSCFADLLEYIDETKDANLGNMVSVVQKYGPRIFGLIKELRNNNYKKSEADVILSTVHKAKGAEFDIVELTEGFITEGDIYSGRYKESIGQGLEELNILYVALTRAKNMLIFPDNILSRGTGLNESEFAEHKLVKVEEEKEEVLEKPF